jgi:hypothetical protein
MNYPVPGSEDLPPYARLVRHDGGPLRLAWLNRGLRLAVKRSFRIDADFGELRGLQAKLAGR